MRFFVINKKQLLFGILATVVIAAVCIGSGNAVMTFLVGGREIPIYSVERNDNRVALTFDCAWSDDDVDDIIKILKSHECGATFFVTGKWAEQYQGTVNKLYREGFEIGSHSYNHDDYTKMSAGEIESDMEKCDKAITKATGYKPILCRAPSGAYNDTVVRTVEGSGRYCIQWSVDGIDYIETTPEEIYSRIVEKTQAGDIILLHCGTEHTAEALVYILDTLSEKYEIVSVSELIYKDNYVIDGNGRQSQREIF